VDVAICLRTLRPLVSEMTEFSFFFVLKSEAAHMVCRSALQLSLEGGRESESGRLMKRRRQAMDQFRPGLHLSIYFQRTANIL
jgi:hypothetical protein